MPNGGDTSPKLMGRREQNKINNRIALLKAARRVFATIGYDAATITDIIQESGLSVGTFYNYFGDKEALFLVLLEDLITEMRGPLIHARTHATSLEQFLRDAFDATMQVFANDPDTLALVEKNMPMVRRYLLSDAKVSGIFADLERDLSTAIERGMMPAFPVRLMSAAMVGTTVEVLIRGAHSGEPDFQAMSRFLATLFIGGIKEMGVTPLDSHH